jgi:hypothetical protein
MSYINSALCDCLLVSPFCDKSNLSIGQESAEDPDKKILLSCHASYPTLVFASRMTTTRGDRRGSQGAVCCYCFFELIRNVSLELENAKSESVYIGIVAVFNVSFQCSMETASHA